MLFVTFQSTSRRRARPGSRKRRTCPSVSIHAPTKGATLHGLDASGCEGSFNPRAHEERDLCHRLDWPTSRGFNPRAHEERDPCSRCASDPWPCFNPRAHEERDVVCRHGLARQCGFNPRAHEERDERREISGDGVARFNPRAHEERDTNDSVNIGGNNSQFQSTRPRRARHSATMASRRRDQVSIHAPTKSATRARQCPVSKCASFNPRAHEERDLRSKRLHGRRQGFQSTRPRRARRSRLAPLSSDSRFQSTRPRRARLRRHAPRAHLEI